MFFNHKIYVLTHAFNFQIIQDRKQLMSVKVSNETKVQEDEEEETFTKRKSFLDMLLEKQEPNSLSDKDIREEVDTFLMAVSIVSTAILLRFCSRVNM